MDKESLIKAREIIIGALTKTNEIDLIDKLELAMNINTFLDTENYEEDVKVLREHQQEKKIKKYTMK